MRGTWFLAVVGGVNVLAHDAFEPLDFDITQALLNHAVDVSSIPALSQHWLVSGASACESACSSLHHLFSGKVSTQNTSTYEALTQSYWSVQQASVDPHCIFSPAAARDVSILVLIARLTRCPFAVKSGGHAAFAGASSIQGGITVSFKDMKTIELSEDKSTASIGPGNTWHDVYHTLEPENLAVIGGRVSAIGIVTATGASITASPSSHTDLYWSLRGGGNNFGIVTKFELETVPQGLIWGGARLHVEEQFDAITGAFYNLGTDSPQDVAAAQVLSLAYAQNTRIASSEVEYSKPIPNASIFSEYLAIPAIEDGTMIRTLSNATLERTRPLGGRRASAFAVDGHDVADKADDEWVLGASRKTIERTVEEGKKMELFVEYIYMNYASQFQNVVPSYGAESLGRLKTVAHTY
ncbi:hypothetical protein PMIN04_003884 [Paraphaeosphaeria minitans]|uniref:FAD-binding PCMH-type domain-containing protein n=1 Tax=Paraphaeosphaeria minitans TaxID=565426 RepID=A0A9P6KT13_9PLEO|nr:hypothetical protein PMIN01_05053 [Paraphaeosphaeria minitans]